MRARGAPRLSRPLGLAAPLAALERPVVVPTDVPLSCTCAETDSRAVGEHPLLMSSMRNCEAEPRVHGLHNGLLRVGSLNTRPQRPSLRFLSLRRP